MLTRILAVATAILATIVVVQYSRITRMSADFAQAQAQAAAQARTALIDSLEGQGAEIQRTLQWLNEFYKSQDGLQRPDGLLIAGHPDFEGIGVWIFDVYLRQRLKGQTEDQARFAIVDAIKQSDEWRRKHP
jgi:hypothetical protein